MAKARKKTLPKDFGTLLEQGDFDAIRAVFDHCDVDARGGYTKQTALAFGFCSDRLTHWLVERGADIAARDNYGETPLHAHAGHWQGRIDVLLALGAVVDARDDRGNTPLHAAARAGNRQAVRLLLEHGGDADALDKSGLTPLALALHQCSNATIEGVAAVAALLLDVPAPRPAGFRAIAGRMFGRGKAGNVRVTPELQAQVRRIGANFEFHRAGFNPDMLEATSAALDRLYVLFDVPPAPRRTMHDGKAAIMAKGDRWEDRHQALWELLVPSSGAAATVQGEVIRISGRIHDEIERNGGANWDADFRKMADAFVGHVGSGVPLPETDRTKAAALVAGARRGNGDVRPLCELAVNWVALNPDPVALSAPDYRR